MNPDTFFCKPEISFINSVAACGIKSTAWLIENLGTRNVDLYAFLQNDLDLLWPQESQVARQKNALYQMAASADNDTDIARVAQIIHDNVSRGNAKIAGIATYLPELTSHDKNKVASDAAQNALKFLVKLSVLLNEKGHPLNTIEIVGGNAVDGLWLGRSLSGRATYVVNRLRKEESLKRLLDRLHDPVEIAFKQKIPIRFAVELEPGPLFNVDNEESLLLICQQIESRGDAYKRVVGLNLDIPHWGFLAGIDHNWVKKHQIVYNRIVHAHICDHSKGHFSDAEPLLFHGYSDFEPWLRLLSELPRGPIQKNGEIMLGYSGFLTCELECCPGSRYAKRSINAIQGFVERMVEDNKVQR